MTTKYHDEMFLLEVEQEADFAVKLHGEFNSLHEAFGVLWEEVDEFWDEVRKKREARSIPAIRHELVQVAAVCLKASHLLERY